MLPPDLLRLPFFEDAHRTFAAELGVWAAATLPGLIDHDDADGSCRRLVRALGDDGWLASTVPAVAGGTIDVRTLALARTVLASHDGLADFAYAMQGLGSGAISLAGDAALRGRYLPPVAAGRAIAAFALSEPEAGSDVAAIATTAVTDGPAHFRVDGEKTWISNGGIADFYVVFARTGEAPGARGLSAFVVDADTPGLTVVERIDVSAPHPLARLRFDGCRVPATNRVGEPGRGFALAMATLDIFRATVGAAALGFACRAQADVVAHAARRKLFGATLADLQMVQAMLADSATEIDAAALLVFRSAWVKDVLGQRTTRESSMAKMYATEAAQRVVDRAVQIWGGLGVTRGQTVERLYREVRALRIYEGATEIQKVVIAREISRAHAAHG